MAITLRDQKFGVEIEMTNITRKDAAEVVSHVVEGTAPAWEQSYNTWYTVDRQGRKWCLKYDSSIVAERPVNERHGIEDYKTELVTPPLAYADLDTLQEVVRRLRKSNATVNGSCGLHIHVDAANHTAKSLRNLLILQYTKQDLLYRACEVRQGGIDTYSKMIPAVVFDSFKGIKAPTPERLADAWYCELGCSYGRDEHYNRSRYHGLNLHSVWFRGTVEWRLFNATLHAGEVKAYVQLCLAMSAKAINATNGFYFEKVDAYAADADKTMYTWLLNLGMKGEEFKTARLHLTKNLKTAVRVAA